MIIPSRGIARGQGRPFGFTLVELIATIVVIGVLSVVVVPQFMRQDHHGVKIAQDNIIIAFAQAQQIAMAQGEASVVVTSTSIDVRSAGVSVSWPGASNPYNFPSPARVSSGTGIWQFDKLGRTESGTIVINDQVSITVEASGYAY